MFLRKPQFPTIYHGSLNPNLKPGDILTPGLEENEEEYPGRASHATTDYATASLYAGGPHQLAPDLRGGMIKKRGAVYQVEPVSRREMNRATARLTTTIKGHVASEKGFRIVGVATRPKDAAEYPKYLGDES